MSVAQDLYEGVELGEQGSVGGTAEFRREAVERMSAITGNIWR
jgi:hypothetical protein